MLTMTPEIEALQVKALAGDAEAATRLRVMKWNASVAVGTVVAYEKSALEGRVLLKTRSKAYVLGDEPMVELEHLGAALLKKIEPL
jgi:hypothetical protein